MRERDPKLRDPNDVRVNSMTWWTKSKGRWHRKERGVVESESERKRREPYKEEERERERDVLRCEKSFKKIILKVLAFGVYTIPK